MAVTIDSAEFFGLAIGGPLYVGIFVCLFVSSSYDLYRRRARNETEISCPMAVAGLLLLALATARFILDVIYVSIAFLQHDTRDARVEYMEEFLARHSLFAASLLVGDLFVIYRCWVVWDRNTWLVAFPLILAIVAAGSGYYLLYAFMHFAHQSIFAQQHSLTLFFSASLVANALATSLLAYRIWSTDRAVVQVMNLDLRSEHHRLTPILRIVLESGAINAALLSAFVIAAAFESPSLEIMSEMGTPMCGIIFSIVIFRVGLRRRGQAWSTTRRMSTLKWLPGGVESHLDQRFVPDKEPMRPSTSVWLAYHYGSEQIGEQLYIG
ncbi:hypothetical protein C8Q76DRAFT_833457 [Earliella scabrosa]|nr:hypothetical protein C8Q76DRAFT_833457 [Earliella scabrosa]